MTEEDKNPPRDPIIDDIMAIEHSEVREAKLNRYAMWKARQGTTQ